MAIDCVESAGDPAEIFDGNAIKYVRNTRLCNGRNIDLASGKHINPASIEQCFMAALEKKGIIPEVQPIFATCSCEFLMQIVGSIQFVV